MDDTDTDDTDTDTLRGTSDLADGHQGTAPVVERRWVGRFMQSLELDDVDNLVQLATEVGDLDEAAEFYNEKVTVADLERRFRHIRWAPRYLSAGFDLTVDEQPPKPTSTLRYVRIPPHSFADHLAHETTPWGRSRFNDPRIAAVVVEAFPIDAPIESIDTALGLLPPLPPVDSAELGVLSAGIDSGSLAPQLDPPDHSAPLEGAWAEWVIAARAVLKHHYQDWRAAADDE